MDTLDRIEEYLTSIEEYFFSSLSAVAHGLPDVHEVADRLWIDISRYGPGLPAFPEVRIPSLGDFQVPPPPPPPTTPPPLNWLEKSSDWVVKHPWVTAGITASAVGTGLLVGYSITHHGKKGSLRMRAQRAKTTEPRQVVVVLGADSPFGLPLVLGLEKRGYIVLASVSTPEAVDTLECRTQGYVKALVLDPHEPLMIPVFLRSLTATLSRKFPINAAGDPFASLSSQPYIQSIVSLLTLPTRHTTSQTLAPLEHVSLPETYLPYLTATHITPLQIIQALLPLMRAGSAITRDKGLKKTVVICLPATDARLGLPFAGVRSMSAAAMERGAEVLRREIRAAGVSGKGAEAMRNIKVVVVDVGIFDLSVNGVSEFQTESIWKAMEGWTASEKVTYGPAFANVLQGHVTRRPNAGRTPWQTFIGIFKGTNQYGVPRKPTDIAVFVNGVVAVVSGGQGGYRIFGVGLGLGKVRNWVRGERFSIGAGAHTYKFASYLPSIMLDILLNTPHFLIGLRNRLSMTQPFRQPPTDLPRPIAPSGPRPPGSFAPSQHDVSDSRPDSPEDDEISSSCDGESVSEASSVVDSSWVSLDRSRADIQESVAGVV